MSIFPANDLVVDVARAADPQRVNAAVQRLADFGNMRAPSIAGLDKSFDATASALRSAPQKFASIAPPSRTTKSTANNEPIAASAATDAARKFEAFILQSFMETLLPKEGHGAYGEGTGSGVWRSMMAEQLGTQLAKAGGIGIGKMLDRDLARKATIAASAANKTGNAG
jgi:peptidoglycan hydrolase FlgJ